MIHNSGPGSYSISAYQMWRPGCFDSERTARYAQRFSDEVLFALQAKVNAEHADFDKRVITFEQLKAAKA